MACSYCGKNKKTTKMCVRWNDFEKYYKTRAGWKGKIIHTNHCLICKECLKVFIKNFPK